MHPNPHRHAAPSGATVSDRLAGWRALTWEELVEFMMMGPGERTPRADLLTATRVPALVRRE